MSAAPATPGHPSALSTVRGPDSFPVPLLLRVLVVDDHRDSADITAHLLQVCGAAAQACYGGAAALAALDAFQPDACVLDLTMPGMGGRELAARIRATERGAGLLLVALTGLDDDRQAADGFDLWLTKPADPAKLLHALGEHVKAGRPPACEPAAPARI